MLNLEQRFNNFLYSVHSKVFAVVGIVSVINLLIGIALLIIRYGSYIDEEQNAQILRTFDILLFVFFIKYGLSFVFSHKSIEFLKKTWFEAFLNSFIFFHGALNYLGNFKLMLSLFAFGQFQYPLFVYQHFVSFYLMVLIGIDFTKLSTKISELNFTPALTFIFSFIFLVLIGTGLLMLPAMTEGRGSIDFLNALFTAVSASCVTGLTVVDTGTYFTFKGHVVIMFLIQVGGIGIVSFATFFASFMSQGVGIKQQSIIQDFLSSESLISAKGLLRKVIIITLLIEFLGFVIIFFSWNEELKFNNLSQKIFFSLFHSVSAFCNAGFSLFSAGLYTNELSSDSPLFSSDGDINIQSMYGLHFTISALIVMGSIGFTTIEEVFSWSNLKNKINQPWKRWKISTYIAIYATGILLLLGTIAFMVLEFEQLTDRTIVEAVITSFFQSVTTRTAGFNTMDFSMLKVPTIIVCIFLMFIGASPGSTGGGIKGSTFYLLLLSAIANIKNQERIEIVNRTIPSDLIHKAYSIFMFATTYNLVATFLLTITEANNENIYVDGVFPILEIVFEQISAFATAGLSMGITAGLSSMGKVIIIISMYIGRVGTLTLALALSSKVVTNSYRYPEGHVMVG